MKRFLMLSTAGISLSVCGAVGLSMAHTTVVDPLALTSSGAIAEQVTFETALSQMDSLQREEVTPVVGGTLHSSKASLALVGVGQADGQTPRPRVRPGATGTGQGYTVVQIAPLSAAPVTQANPVIVPQPVAQPASVSRQPATQEDLGQVWMVGVYR